MAHYCQWNGGIHHDTPNVSDTFNSRYDHGIKPICLFYIGHYTTPGSMGIISKSREIRIPSLTNQYFMRSLNKAENSSPLFRFGGYVAAGFDDHRHESNPQVEDCELLMMDTGNLASNTGEGPLWIIGSLAKDQGKGMLGENFHQKNVVCFF